MYDMDMRDYDPASARWYNIDPVTHFSQSPFMAMNGNPVTFSDPSGADGHNWNPYSDMSINNYGANGTSSPGRNSNGDNDGGSSIFWGSSAMLFEQSYEGHILNSMFTTKNPDMISSILNYYSKQNEAPVYSIVGEVGPIQNGYGEFGNTLNPETLGQQFFGIGKLTYPGPFNPKTYNGKDDYSYIPSRIEELPAFLHDKAYDKLNIRGGAGLFTATSAINADWKFVSQELKTAMLSNNMRTKYTAAALGIGLGVAALPKTIYNSNKNNLRLITQFATAFYNQY